MAAPPGNGKAPPRDNGAHRAKAARGNRVAREAVVAAMGAGDEALGTMTTDQAAGGPPAARVDRPVLVVLVVPLARVVHGVTRVVTVGIVTTGLVANAVLVVLAARLVLAVLVTNGPVASGVPMVLVVVAVATVAMALTGLAAIAGRAGPVAPAVEAQVPATKVIALMHNGSFLLELRDCLAT